MKTTSLCALSLVTILGGVMLGGGSASADALQLDSTGKVIVTEGQITPDDKTPDPEHPDKDLPDNPDIPVNPDAGSLIIQRVSNMDFGTIKTSGTTVTANAKPITIGEGETRGAIVGWSDIRAGGTFGYTITAELAQQFTGATATNVLNGATIDYSNGLAVAAGENKNVVPSNVATAFQLTQDGGAKTIVTADKVQKEGKGSYVMEFGQSDKYVGTEGTAGTDKTAVKLTVPTATASNMALDTYTAKVTWKVTAAA